MDDFFLGRQPILDRRQNLVAFELLFRSSDENHANIKNNLSATANVIVNAYGQLGIEKTLGQHRGFINVDAELLLSDVILLLPSENVVLEIVGSTKITNDIVQRCIELKQKGYQFALDNVIEVNDEIELLLSIVHIVKIDVLAMKDEAALIALVNKLKRWPVLLLAVKISDMEHMERCTKLGFEMFQGYYFSKPEIISGKRADPAKLALLNLLTIVMSDADISDVEKEFKHQPSLSFNLVRMVNSAASGLPRKVDSIKHAIMILGRKQLQRWIQLLLYANKSSDGSMSNAMMQMAAVRGRLLELIATEERPHDKNHQDRAFMVGILSLLDALLGMEMKDIVAQLGVTDDMEKALLRREGRLGIALSLIEAMEKGEVAAAETLLIELGFLSMNELTSMDLEALDWANKVGEDAD